MWCRLLLLMSPYASYTTRATPQCPSRLHKQPKTRRKQQPATAAWLVHTPKFDSWACFNQFIIPPTGED